MPIIKSSDTKRSQSVTDIIQSVALEQAALANILEAEGDKIKRVLECCNNISYTFDNNLRKYDFVYKGVIPYYGYVAEGLQTAVIQLTDEASGTNTLTYCFDINNFLEVGDHYTLDTLKGSTDISENNANRIRSILFNAFPFIDLGEIIARSGIPGLNQEEAISATQLAIWKLTNNFSANITNTDILALYNWYLTLAPTPIIAKSSSIHLSGKNIPGLGDCSVEFTFYSEDEETELSYTFDRDIVSEYGAVISEEAVGEKTIVRITNLPINAHFKIIVTGHENLALDAYRFRDNQDLCGLFQQTNYMSATAEYFCSENCYDGALEVNRSVMKMVKSITMLEIVLKDKLELFDNCVCDE